MREHETTVRRHRENGMAEPVPTMETKNHVYYMSHQQVIRESSNTTQLRVVFDASFHNGTPKSLNECLQSAPNLNTDIVTLLLRFRRHTIALVVDVEKAFLQISIKEEDRDVLRYLQYEVALVKDERLPRVVTWRMARVPFGTASRTFFLAATLRHLLGNMQKTYPETSELIIKPVYVVDIFMGQTTRFLH